MAHYYAFCKVHKKCGPNRSDVNDAWNDCEAHEKNVKGPHGKVFPKSSSKRSVNGTTVYTYKLIKLR